MPLAVRLFRLFTAIITLVLVVVVLRVSDGSTVGKVMAALILLLGAGQWLVLSALGRKYATLETPPDADEG